MPSPPAPCLSPLLPDPRLAWVQRWTTHVLALTAVLTLLFLACAPASSAAKAPEGPPPDPAVSAREVQSASGQFRVFRLVYANGEVCYQSQQIFPDNRAGMALACFPGARP